ncbi:MAG: hypothetical protein K2K55_03325 [Duncaniella sp.]|nr:hypothetical protein [Duncaniella sp.]
MKSLGKGIFWLGFILLMGVVMAYLIIMMAHIAVFAMTSVALTMCAIILISGLLMLIGRSYERKGEAKDLDKIKTRVETEAKQLTGSSESESTSEKN